MARRELMFQNHIIDSYKLLGGYAKKWASDLAVGNPDLVCSIPWRFTHFVEVKHLPTWNGEREIKNPMTPKQIIECRKWAKTKVPVFLGIVTGTKAVESRLYYCHPFDEKVSEFSVYAVSKYVPKEKFDVDRLTKEAFNFYRWEDV